VNALTRLNRSTQVAVKLWYCDL